MRTHISLPDDLVAEIDELAGPKGRSKFIEDAVRAKLLNAKQRAVLKKLAELGPPPPEEMAHWVDSTAWVANLRREDEKIRSRIFSD